MDAPPPDLIDSRGRARRLVLSFVIGVVCGAIAYIIADGLAKPEAMPGGWDGGSQRRAFGFVFYMTGIAFLATFSIALAIQNHLEKKRYRKSLGLPAATLRTK
jgi:hypothetical protein